MMDRFTKVVLTVIAAALVWLCVVGPGPKWGKPVGAEAQDQEALSTPLPGKVVDVNIVSIVGRRPHFFAGRLGVVVDSDPGQLRPVEVKVVNLR